MADALVGKVEVKDANGKTIFIIDPGAPSTQVRLQEGSTGASMMEMSNQGTLALKSSTNSPIILLSATNGMIKAGGAGQDGKLWLNDAANHNALWLSAHSGGRVAVGGGDKGGTITVSNDKGEIAIELDVETMATIRAGGGLSGKHGLIEVARPGGTSISLNSATAGIVAGGTGQYGELELRGATDYAHIKLGDDGGVNAGSISAGGGGKAGGISLKDGAGTPTILLNTVYCEISAGGGGKSGNLELKSGTGTSVISVDAETGTLAAGGGGQSGDLALRNGTGASVISADAATATVAAGGQGQSGDLVLRSTTGTPVISADAATGIIGVGGSGSNGKVWLSNASGASTIVLGGSQDGELMLARGGKLFGIKLEAKTCSITAGGDNEQDGDLTLRNASGEPVVTLNAFNGDILAGGGGRFGTLTLTTDLGEPVIRVDAYYGDITTGGGLRDGTLTLKNAGGQNVIVLDAANGDLNLGGPGRSGDLFMRDASGKDTIHLRASDGILRVGGNGQDGDVLVYRADNTATLKLNANTGDIVLANADCAEDFDVDDPNIEPGTVLVLDDQPGRLRRSDVPYDSRVAGVVSGAGECRPGIILGRQSKRESRRPVALVGKVFCKVEAESSPVEPGTLLTTSDMPGHAMAARDRDRALGAVLGKALAPLSSGIGLIPVLVTLQ